MCEIVCLKKKKLILSVCCNSHFFTIRGTEGGFLLLSRCVECSGSRTK